VPSGGAHAAPAGYGAASAAEPGGVPVPYPVAYANSAANLAVRLRALAKFTKLIADASSTLDVAEAAAAEAYRQLDAAAVSISMWERETGLLRVLVNHGGQLGDISDQPKNETYPVTDFPTVLLSEDDLGPWIQTAEAGTGDPKRVDLMRSRGLRCALIAPIVFGGRAWGELYAARNAHQPDYTESDLDYAEALSTQVAAGLARASQMEHIERLALTDQLTGLANRRAFDARLDAAMDRHNTDGTVVSLVLCDGNGLKRINDTHGHDHGDALLVELGACVSAAASRLPRALAARLGGDEFCLLIEGFTADDAVTAAEDLCLRALTVRGGEGMSCGVASTGDPIGRVATRDGLFRLADAAQYRAKRSRSLSPVVAGRGQPPDPALPIQQRGVPVAAGRGRASAPIEALLGQALAGLDKLPPGAQRADRVEVIVDQVARGLDAASWYIYRRATQQGPLFQERSAVYRAASESGSYTIPGAIPEPQPRRPVEVSPTSPPQLIEPIPRIAEQLRGFGAVTPAVGQDSNWDPGDLGISPEFLAAAGYTSALSAGATATDGSQWLVAVLLDEISLWALPALPLLRVLLATSVTT
jgi:diguanylate cyclase (GGDEF)-like protein